MTLRCKGALHSLAALIGTAALVVAMAQPAVAQPSFGDGAPEPAATQQAGFDRESDTGNWIVSLEGASLATYDGEVPGLPATSPAVTGAAELDVAAPASVAYRSHLAGTQDELVASMEDLLDRPVTVANQYLNVLNGLAVEVSAAEAARLAELPGVESVVPDDERELDTDVSQSLIGSPSFWDGETGPGLATRGEGVVVGVIDTGVNTSHPSFAEVSPGDGYEHENPFGSGNFVGACDPADPNHQPVCNDKLIGAYNLNPTGPNFPSVQDWNSHGSHTASTAAGNLHAASFTLGQSEFTRTIQGVAPRANIISYLICDPGCPSASAVAAVDRAIADGVDVLNYSISGTDNPWVDPVDLAFLDAFEAGIFVAASAGNDGPNTVAKTGPWNASVAASTHGRIFAHTVDALGPTPPPELTGMPAVPGDGPQVAADIAGEIRFVESNPTGCDPFAAGAFDGAIALIQRGDCTFAVKVLNAEEAGAIAVVIFNHQGGPPISPGGLGPDDGDTTVPTVMLERRTGDSLRDLILDTAPTPTEARINVAVDVFTDPDAWEDVMAAFSSTGPSQFEMLAPTFTAPGVNILAAAAAAGDDPVQYTQLQGTSMSSPHGAGAGALLTALHPDWSPAQVRSALAATAEPEGVLAPDGDTPGTQFNYGSGRLDLNQAARVGLVLDETTENFEAANPILGGDPKTLNIPAMVDHSCAVCSWERSVTSVADAEATYTASVEAPAGMSVTVTPSEFTVAPGATVDLEVNVDATGLPQGQWAFADLQLVTGDSHTGGEPISAVHYPIGVITAPEQTEAPQITVEPDELTSVQGPDETVTQELTIGNTGDADLQWSVFENAPARLPQGVPSPVAAGEPAGTLAGGASLTTEFQLPSGIFGGSAPEVATPEAVPTQEGDVTISHSQSQTIVAENAVACSSDDGITTTDNAYLRHFTLPDFDIAGEFAVTEVSFGVEVLRDTAHPLTVNLFQMIDPGGPFTYANLEPIGSATENVPPQELSIVSVPVSGTADAGSTLVVEIDAPDLTGTGAFFVGTNSNGQTAPSYIRSDSCGISEPTDLAAIGFPAVHVVMNVTGTADVATPTCEVPSGTPWADVAPLAGTVTPGGEQVVQVTLDSTGLAAGDELSADLCLESNDPADPLVTVPVTLQVEELQTPVVDVTPGSLAAELPAGGVTDQSLTIGNLGDGVLDWQVFTDEPERLPTGATPVEALAVPAAAATSGLGTNPDGEPGTTAVPEAEPLQADDVTITHSVSQSIVELNSVACTPGGGVTTDNGYLRHFVLPDFDITGEFAVNEVSFGVETINGPPHPVTINLYTMTDPTGPFTYANFDLIGSAQEDLPAQALTMVGVPVSGAAPAGSTLVVEIDTPDLSGSGGGFFIGSNPDGQTAPSYIRSGSCGFTEPTDLADLGVPDMHIVMNVTGTTDTEPAVCGAPTDVSWLSAAPESGSTGAGESSEVTVTFDAIGLEPGDYEALLCVVSNDPVTPLVQVPVSLTVTEDGGQPVCDETITGVHSGPLTVTEGVTCLAAGAQVLGEVNVSEGAGLIATAAVIQGPVSAIGARTVELVFSQVTGPVLVNGTTGNVSLFGSQVTGSVTLLSNVTPAASAVSGNTIIGSLSCFGNQPAPTDHGLPNTATGGKLGQCAGL